MTICCVIDTNQFYLCNQKILSIKKQQQKYIHIHIHSRKPQQKQKPIITPTNVLFDV